MRKIYVSLIVWFAKIKNAKFVKIISSFMIIFVNAQNQTNLQIGMVFVNVYIYYQYSD